MLSAEQQQLERGWRLPPAVKGPKAGILDRAREGPRLGQGAPQSLPQSLTEGKNPP